MAFVDPEPDVEEKEERFERLPKGKSGMRLKLHHAVRNNIDDYNAMKAGTYQFYKNVGHKRKLWNTPISPVFAALLVDAMQTTAVNTQQWYYSRACTFSKIFPDALELNMDTFMRDIQEYYRKE